MFQNAPLPSDIGQPDPDDGHCHTQEVAHELVAEQIEDAVKKAVRERGPCRGLARKGARRPRWLAARASDPMRP